MICHKVRGNSVVMKMSYTSRYCLYAYKLGGVSGCRLNYIGGPQRTAGRAPGMVERVIRAPAVWVLPTGLFKRILPGKPLRRSTGWESWWYNWRLRSGGVPWLDPMSLRK